MDKSNFIVLNSKEIEQEARRLKSHFSDAKTKDMLEEIAMHANTIAEIAIRLPSIEQYKRLTDAGDNL